MNKKETIELLKRYLDGNASAEDLFIIDKWYGPGRNVEIANKQNIKETLLKRIEQELYHSEKVVPFYKKYLFKAAAVLVFAIGTALFFYNNNTRQSNQVTVKPKVTNNDIQAPQYSKATIKLASGRIVPVDSIHTGILLAENDLSIEKLKDGRLIYKGKANEFNTLYNPRGSNVVSLELSDGSRVWLNNESSIKYPVVFPGNERKVEITGEVYFEIAHQPQRPFRVIKDGMSVEVFGTKFNVNSFSNEASSKITLLEGSVAVQLQKNKVYIKPGEQAVVAQKIKVVDRADLEAVMAWKNGVFSLSNTDLQTIMRQIARWYDVDVEYEGKVAERKFGGEVSRTSSISEVLKILKESKINFRMEGRKVIIMQ